MRHGAKRVAVAFYRTPAGTEPVREWFRELAPEERRTIGEDIAVAEYGWPIGMPVCGPLGRGLWEVRSNLSGNRTARVVFCIARGQLVLLHAFMKKTRKTPAADLTLAYRRMREIAL